MKGMILMKRLIIILLLAVTTLGYAKYWYYPKDDWIHSDTRCTVFYDDIDFQKNSSVIIGNYGILHSGYYLITVQPEFGKIGDIIDITFDTKIKITAKIAGIIGDTSYYNNLSSNPALWGWRKKVNNCIFEFIVDYESFRKSNMKEKNLDSVYTGKIVEIHNPNIK